MEELLEDSINGYLIPFKFGRSLALGRPPEGFRIGGPILYFPGHGAIFYKSSIQGDAERMGIVTIDVGEFENQEIFLSQLERQMKGQKPEYGDWTGSRIDLSDGVIEIRVPKSKLAEIAGKALEAYAALDKFRTDAMQIYLDLKQPPFILP